MTPPRARANPRDQWPRLVLFGMLNYGLFIVLTTQSLVGLMLSVRDFGPGMEESQLQHAAEALPRLQPRPVPSCWGAGPSSAMRRLPSPLPSARSRRASC